MPKIIKHMPKPGKHYRGLKDPERVATVTRVWAKTRIELETDPSVSFDLWEPGYAGAPGSWGSACAFSVFCKNYDMDSEY